MHDLLELAHSFPGFNWLLLTISAAGIIRGFTGFGTAMIFVPIANLYLPPQQVILIITLTGIGSAFALLPRAVTQAELKDVSILGIAALITVPLGVWLISQFDHVTIRWIAAGLILALLVALLLGWRYRGGLSYPGMGAIGGVAGVFGGLTGLTGPVVILFYLASGARALIVRANTIVFLAMLDVVIAINLAISGYWTREIVIISIVLCIPYFITSRIGQSFFAPEYERLYRLAAYGVIGMAVLTGLPLWDKG